jgi:hypothetical protein
VRRNTAAIPPRADPDMPQTEAEAWELASRMLKKLGEAQVYLTKTGMRSYLMPAVMRLRPVPKYHDDLRTMAVDSYWRLYFYPPFVNKNSIQVLSAVIEHEIWHLLLQHHRVAEKVQIPSWAHILWNLSADAELHNDDDLYARVTKDGFPAVNHESLGSPKMPTLLHYYKDLMERAIIYKTGVSYEVFVNHVMPQDLYDEYDQAGGITVIHKGSQVK